MSPLSKSTRARMRNYMNVQRYTCTSVFVRVLSLKRLSISLTKDITEVVCSSPSLQDSVSTLRTGCMTRSWVCTLGMYLKGILEP